MTDSVPVSGKAGIANAVVMEVDWNAAHEWHVFDQHRFGDQKRSDDEIIQDLADSFARHRADVTGELLDALGKLINFYAEYRTAPDGWEILPADEQDNEHVASAMRLYAKATGAA